MRSFSLGLLLLFVGLVPARRGDLPHFDDAALRAVQFIDDREGWAVGDDGVVWHTIDGGKNWERQPTGVRASLRSVQFVNPYVGWIAGREELPGGGSAGVVLYTHDGGVKWRRLLVNALPGLNLVRFVDAKTGYLAGDGSEQYPAGLFATTDSGQTWAPGARDRAALPGGRATSTARAAALAGAWNRLATVRRAQVFSVEMDSLGGRNLCGLQLRGDGGVAVGQGGLVLLSGKSRGSTWHYAELGLPPDVQATWDFHAVHGAGPHVWAVGRPGSAALHSPDGGKTWQIVRTGQTMPLQRRVLPRREEGLGRRRTGHGPGHQRRRPDLAGAAPRRPARRRPVRPRPAGRHSPRRHRPARRPGRLPDRPDVRHGAGTRQRQP